MGRVTELAWGSLDTPLGQVFVACTGTGVARVVYGPPPGAARAPAPGTPAAVLLEGALGELAEYFGGSRKEFTVPVDLGRAREARRSVLSMLHETVRFGQTITYGGLAARAGLDAATGPGGAAVPPARVVGQIMASNPVALIVPGCWCSRARSRRHSTGIRRACARSSRRAPGRPDGQHPPGSPGAARPARWQSQLRRCPQC